MKTSALIVSVILSGFSFAQEANAPKDPRLADIDFKLAQLNIALKQNTDTINRLTNFKRTPVQQGSQAYYQCLEASKRIQAAEASIKTLQAQRNALAGSPKGASTANSEPSLTGGVADQARQGNFDRDLETAAQRMMGFWKESLEEYRKKEASKNTQVSDENDTSSQEERAEIAEKQFMRIDPRNYVHSLEAYSPTLKMINAKLSLQGKNLKEINDCYEKKYWLKLLGILNNSDLKEFPHIKAYSSKEPGIEGLVRRLGENKFFLRLSPLDPSKPILKVFDNQRYTIPRAMLPEMANVWDNGIVTPTHGGDFSPHPEGESQGYLAEWMPEQGPVLLKLPMRPNYFHPVAHILESTTERYTLKGNFFGEEENYTKFTTELGVEVAGYYNRFNKKVELGEITEQEANDSFLAVKLEAYKKSMKFLAQW